MWAKTNNTHSRTGFTIVELLIVIIVIGILAALVLVAYSNVTNQAKVTTLQADLTQAGKQLALDKERGGGSTYPASLSAANNGNGITASSGNTLTYTPLPASNPTSYCLTDSNGATSYYLQNGSSAQAGTCPTQGLIGWWKLNGDASDSTGNGYTGNFISGTPTSASGQNGAANGAYTFNNQYIQVSSVASALNGVTQFSISGWVKPLNNPSAHNSYFGYRNNSTFDFYILQLQGTNNLECRYRNSSGTQVQGTAPSVTPSVWQLMTFTYDGSNVRCYVNAVSSSAVSATGVPSSGGEFDIAATTGTNAMTGGSIDDVRLYNRALSATDVQNLYNAGAQ